MSSRHDLQPLTSPRMLTARQQGHVPWEWHCDHEDEAREELPPIQESRSQIRTPYEGDKLAEFWAIGLIEEVPTGPLAFVEAIWFQSIVGCVISANALIIGIETDLPSPYWGPIEQVMLVFFVVELVLRLSHHGIYYFNTFGNIFDVLIVMAGVFDMWCVPVVNFLMGRVESRRSAFMSAIQMLRLLRIIRLIRLVKIVQPLYRLALGIAEAVQGMFWVLVFLAMMLYAMAVLLTRIIGKEMSSNRIVVERGPRDEVCSGGCSLEALTVAPAEIEAMFISVSSSMFVLFETMSCWSLMKFSALFERIPIIKLFAVCFYIFAAWALLAVMTGVVSEKMIAAREKMNFEVKNRENEKKEMATEVLAELFSRADADGSGSISRDEFDAMLMWTDVTKQLMQHSAVNMQDLSELFDWMDKEKDGMVDIGEFLGCLAWLNDSISPKSFLKLQEEVASTLRNIEKKMVTFVNHRFDALLAAVATPLRKIGAVTQQIQRIDVQLCTRGSVSGATTETLEAIAEEFRRQAPLSRAALEELEESVSARIDELMGLVDRLAELQAKGLVRLRNPAWKRTS